MWVLRRVGVCMRISACSLANPATTRMRHTVTSFMTPRSSPYFSTLSHKRCDFRKKDIEHEMCVFIFSTIFVQNISHPKKNLTRYRQKFRNVFM